MKRQQNDIDWSFKLDSLRFMNAVDEDKLSFYTKNPFYFDSPARNEAHLQMFRDRIKQRNQQIKELENGTKRMGSPEKKH